jgi:hypothetical protein
MTFNMSLNFCEELTNDIQVLDKLPKMMIFFLNSILRIKKMAGIIPSSFHDTAMYKIRPQMEDAKKRIKSGDTEFFLNFLYGVLGEYPLYFAKEICDQVLDSKTINIRNKQGDTLLIGSICVGCLELTKFLVDAKSDINAQGENGGTALHTAVNWSRSMNNYLINSGASTLIEDNYGRTPIDKRLPSHIYPMLDDRTRDELFTLKNKVSIYLLPVLSSIVIEYIKPKNLL